MPAETGSTGCHKYIRVSYCTELKPCKCSNCTWIDPEKGDNKCWAQGSALGGVVIAEPDIQLDYCKYYEEAIE